MLRKVALGVLLVSIGFFLGGVTFSDSQPRSFLSLSSCTDCLSSESFLGLAGSVVILKTPWMLPNRVLETDHIVAFEHPLPSYPHHYVILPKRDIHALDQLEAADAPYLEEMMAAIGILVREKKLDSYIVWSNGGKRQDVQYLHVHLGADQPETAD